MRKKLSAKAILIPTVSLFLICLVVTAVLALTNEVTADQIAQNEAQSKTQSMKNVCADAVSFEEIIPDVMYLGVDENGNAAGYAVSTAAQGYGGQVKVMTGIKYGVITGVDVYYNDDETPGLGKNTSNNSFTDQYQGMFTNYAIAVSKDSSDAQTVDAVTSATISSRAVTKAVSEACDIYNEQIGETLDIGDRIDISEEEMDAISEKLNEDGEKIFLDQYDTEQEGE